MTGLLSSVDITVLTIIFTVGIIAAIMSGYPIMFTLGALGFVMGYLTIGPAVGDLMYNRGFKFMLGYPLLAMPLFVYMGYMLAESGITDNLYQAIAVVTGGFRGGLAIGTVIFGTVLAACLGVITASTSMLTVLALGPMLKRGYNRPLACGAICAAGCLGIIIPPSIMFVILGPLAEVSVGKLFMGAFGPGLMLSGMYCIYIAVRSWLQPSIAPALPPEERAGISVAQKIRMLATSMLPPVILILSVLGVIFMGIAPPTEAAASGCVAATVLALAYRKFSFSLFKKCLLETGRTVSFALGIGFFAVGMAAVFIRLGCGGVIGDWILAVPGRWGSFAAIMFALFILGMLMGWLPILFIMIPVVMPILPELGFDKVWFIMMMAINLNMAFMTPPMALAIFVLKGTADPSFKITTAEIIRGVIPFIIIIMIGLVLMIIFPQIILFLPNHMVRAGW
jgi:tripartite ATP-independent transporter DctM subunit